MQRDLIMNFTLIEIIESLTFKLILLMIVNNFLLKKKNFLNTDSFIRLAEIPSINAYTWVANASYFNAFFLSLTGAKFIVLIQNVS